PIKNCLYSAQVTSVILIWNGGGSSACSASIFNKPEGGSGLKPPEALAVVGATGVISPARVAVFGVALVVVGEPGPRLTDGVVVPPATIGAPITGAAEMGFAP